MDGPLPDGPNPRPVFETMLVLDGRAGGAGGPPRAPGIEPRRALFGRSLPAMRATSCSRRPPTLALGRLRLDVSPDAGHSRRAGRGRGPGARIPGLRPGASSWPLAVPGGIGAHKWADRRLLERARRRRGHAADPRSWWTDGTVLETSRGSVFLVRDGCSLTPPADGRLLPGVTRAACHRGGRGGGHRGARGELPLDAPLQGRRGLHDRCGARRGAGARRARAAAVGAGPSSPPRISADLRSPRFGRAAVALAQRAVDLAPLVAVLERARLSNTSLPRATAISTFARAAREVHPRGHDREARSRRSSRSGARSRGGGAAACAGAPARGSPGAAGLYGRHVHVAQPDLAVAHLGVGVLQLDARRRAST